ncbi:MAG: elongation factor P [Syntrophales bacterium]|nr:elongation factor P [Syntrophales bacterium]
MYSASDLRKNLRIMLDDDPYIVVDFQFVKPGKGQSLYRCKLRNMLTGSQMDRTFRERTFREVDTFQPAETEEKNMQFLYEEADAYHFMDNESFEQIALTEEQVGDAKNFLIENMECKVLLFRDRPIDITLPNFVDVVVTEAPPWIKGDTVSGNYKPVIVETGYKVSVPPFIEQGQKIRIDTRTGEYLTRVKE